MQSDISGINHPAYFLTEIKLNTESTSVDSSDIQHVKETDTDIRKKC